MVFATGVVVAADTREILPGGAVRDDIGKLARAPWGLVTGGGREDILTQAKESLGSRPNPSLDEVHALFTLALGASAEMLPPTELLFSYEPKESTLPSCAGPGGTAQETARQHPVVTLYRDEGGAGPLTPIRIAVLPPRDIDREAVVDWIGQKVRDPLGLPDLPSREVAVAIVLEGFRAFGSKSGEVSPDLDVGIHEQGRRFRLVRLWW